MLPTSGTLSATQINTELGRSSTSKFDMNATEERRLGQKLTTNSTIKYSDFRGKYHKFNTPAKPWISSSGYGTVVIKTDSDASILYKGETKPSGSTWTHDDYEYYSGNAVAYRPATSYVNASDYSSGLWIGMLGKPMNGGADAAWDNYNLWNCNNTSATMHITGKLGSGSEWYFQLIGPYVINANSSRCDWESDGGHHRHSDSARWAMWNAAATWFHFTKTGWITSMKEIVKPGRSD